MTFVEIAAFCMKYAGYRASGFGMDKKEVLGTLTSYNNNIIYLAKDTAPWFVQRENEPNLKIPFIVSSSGDYFVVKKARSGMACHPTTVVIISHAKEEVEKLIKALEL